ncbi:hypothetical protein AMS68_005268 [Peltaster fructicola]|uniref:Transcription factor CBF/NF-Y/archaeal histone domain-containing protein n=1 Tax=Peltaster fructicola TaxID=286661 RepID=A0A6H0XYK8_9PEZI|nr:hypothetical protein AMS68_005268 [Peltaster fructicola]
MPYNTAPIERRKEVTGTVNLPLARVKKIIAQDDDIHQCSANAAFVITAATEMFLQHLVEQSYNVAKSEHKPRRNIQYRDIVPAHAVARVENLEFLADVVPKTTTYKQFKQKQAKNPAPAANGQMTLDGALDHSLQDQEASEPMDVDESDVQPEDQSMAIEESLLGSTERLGTATDIERPSDIVRKELQLNPDEKPVIE